MRSKSPVYPFIIVLKNKQQSAIRLTGILLGLIAIALFVYRSLQSGGSGLNWVAAAAAAMMLILSAWDIRKKKTTRFRPLLLLTAGGLALFPPHSLLAIPFLLLAWLEKEAWAGQEIGFAEDHVLINGLWSKKVSWSDLQNVVLKDGLLTIDFKNNRILQREADDLDDADYDGDEDEFNTFCRSQLLKHHH